MKKQKFKRTDAHKYSKLGVRRKNKQKYRKAKGTDNKMRLKMKGHLRNVSIGFGSKKKTRGLVRGLVAIKIHNLKDLKKIGKKEIGIVGKIGNKKRKEVLDYAIKHGIKLNIDAKKSLEKIEEKLRKAKEKREKRMEKRKVKEKKTKEKRTKKDEKKEEKKTESATDKKEMEEAVKHETDVKEHVEDKK